jgi:uncharacterized sulfatase
MPKARKIVFIMTDTQRRDMLGCYGFPDMFTPNLDRLAREGMRFDKAYTCQPVCAPARSAIFTGLFPHTNGVWSNCSALGDNVHTIAQRLSDHGFHTAHIGKWHLDGGDYFGLGRCPEGWDPDYWYDMRCYLEELTPNDRLRSRNIETNRDASLTADFTFGHRCTSRAIDFLEHHHDEDFFLTVSYDEPHDPCLCPSPFSSMYRNYHFPKAPNVWDTLADKPQHHRVWAGKRLLQDKDDLQISVPDYLGCNSFVDSEIGRLLDAIDRCAPEALIIYTSDHGDMLASHSLWNKGPAMYEEITHIPLLARWRGVIAESSVHTHPVSHINITPTLMDAAGIVPSKWMDGKSILPVLMDSDVRVNEAVFLEFGRYEVDHDGFGGFQPIRCICDGRYKLAVNLLTSDELYDLEDDPGEMKNLILSKDHSSIRNSLHDQLLDWMNQSRDPFRGYYWERRIWREGARSESWNYTEMTRQRENEEYEPRQLDYSTGMEITDATRRK